MFVSAPTSAVAPPCSHSAPRCSVVRLPRSTDTRVTVNEVPAASVSAGNAASVPLTDTEQLAKRVICATGSVPVPSNVRLTACSSVRFGTRTSPPLTARSSEYSSALRSVNVVSAVRSSALPVPSASSRMRDTRESDAGSSMTLSACDKSMTPPRRASM